MTTALLANTSRDAAGHAAGSAPVIVALDGVDKRFGPNPLVLEGVSLDVREGEFVALLGASGCGKSTLLNMIAELESPSAGRLTVPEEGAAFMFQDHALFPWLTARENVKLALKLAGVPRAQRHDRAAHLLKLVRLDHAADRRPHELSGGMRQRVALARALAQDRRVLLMDEPFAALDAITRDLMHHELKRIWAETGTTIIFVTHNVREAVCLGQRVVLLSSRPGRVAAEWSTAFVSNEDHHRAESDLVDEITARLREEIGRHAH
ncbi:ABC transporter ATP-binding protein [Micrococcales bacterium 31B]|nr:ABC transporter ATP-binding protein [Micrococcales bacterium 31B]